MAANQIKNILSAQDQNLVYKNLLSLAKEYFSSQNIESSKELLHSVLNSDLTTPNIRQILSGIVEIMSLLSNNSMMEIGNYCLELLSPRSSSFEEEELKIRDHIYDVYCARKDYLAAARVLSAINFEALSRSLTVDAKCDKYIKIAECYLEIGESSYSEQYNSRASSLIENCTDISTKLRYKVCHARVLDSKKEFLQASRNYYILSQEGKYGVMESDLLQLLQCAITCAILAKAGPQRSRLLATLYQDERSSHLENYDILEKLFMQRIIKKPDVEKFSEKLLDHHRALLSTGRTVLETAMIEHNIIAISKIYSNLNFNELGDVLQISPSQAEQYVADMVQENRIRAVLDQRTGVVEFEDENEGFNEWETQINVLCKSVEDVIRLIQVAYG